MCSLLCSLGTLAEAGFRGRVCSCEFPALHSCYNPYPMEVALISAWWQKADLKVSTQDRGPRQDMNRSAGEDPASYDHQGASLFQK